MLFNKLVKLDVLKTALILILILIFITSCGYKKLNLEKQASYNIAKITINGEKRIGNLIKNEIKFNSEKDAKNLIELVIKINKNREVKEKNISNKVIKYTINLQTQIEFKNINKNENYTENFNNSYAFDVAKNYSDTISNEKKAIEILTEKTIDQIMTSIKDNI